MNPTTPENTPEVKNTQVEPAPPIKTEENQANWKAFREQRDADRKARDEADKRAQQKAEEAAALRAALEAMTNKTNQPEERDETEETRLERRIQEIILEREKIFIAERQQQEASQYPDKLRTVYSDFNSVCSTENLDYLEFHYPEVAVPFKHMPEGFDKWAAIYKAIKRFIPNPDSQKDSSRADRNLLKPATMSTPGTSQGGSAMPSARLTDERKAENWARMERARKGLG